MSQPTSELVDAIVDLFQSIKIRKEAEAITITEEFLKKEKKELETLSPVAIINYIKTHIDILIDLKVKEKINQMQLDPVAFIEKNGTENGINEYEELLRKHEKTIRGNIKIQNMLKLHIEDLNYKIEHLERTINALQKKHLLTPDDGYRKEIEHLTTLVKTYEKNNLKIPLLEKKLKIQKIELDQLDNYYKEKIRSYSKKIEKYEREISTNRTQRNNTNSTGATINTINVNSPTFASFSHRTINNNNNESIDEQDKSTDLITFKKKNGLKTRKNSYTSTLSATSRKMSSTMKKFSTTCTSKNKYTKPTSAIKKIPKATSVFGMKSKSKKQTRRTSTEKEEKIQAMINNISNIQNVPCVNNFNIYAGGYKNGAGTTSTLKRFLMEKISSVSSQHKSKTSKHSFVME